MDTISATSEVLWYPLMSTNRVTLWGLLVDEVVKERSSN